MLLLYSFWVPQIVLNIITEAKTPLHHSLIYGMSISRLFAPLYILGIRDNFLREVFPEAPYDVFTCQMIVIWVALQTDSLECSICYEGIDIRKRHDYMLAPCNHLFHRECLVQWMDVKMECPICRTDLPVL